MISPCDLVASPEDCWTPEDEAQFVAHGGDARGGLPEEVWDESPVAPERTAALPYVTVEYAWPTGSAELVGVELALLIHFSS